MKAIVGDEGGRGDGKNGAGHDVIPSSLPYAYGKQRHPHPSQRIAYHINDISQSNDIQTSGSRVPTRRRGGPSLEALLRANGGA